MTRNHRMRKSNGQQGAITVYLSIIILVIIALVGTMVDGARIRVAESQVGRTVEAAMMSTLAGYSKTLKEDYGLFALYENNPEQLKEMVTGYINKNLMTEVGMDTKGTDDKIYGYLKGLIFKGQFEGVKFTNLFDYSVGETQVTPFFNLSENEVLRNQITEFMKYRAPKEMAEEMDRVGFLKKIQEVKKISNTSKALEKKIELEGLLGKLGEAQNELAIRVEYINKFPDSTVRIQRALDEDLEADNISFTGRSRDYLSSASRYLSRLPGSEEKEISPAQWLLIESAESEKNRDFRLMNQNLGQFKDFNALCLPSLKTVVDVKKELNQKLAEYRNYLNIEEKNLEGSFAASFKEDIDLAAEAVERDKAEALEVLVGENKSLLEKAISQLASLDGSIRSYKDKDNKRNFSDDFQDIIETLKGKENPGGLYNKNLVYKYMSYDDWKGKKGISSTGSAAKDPRKTTMEMKKGVDAPEPNRQYKKLEEEKYKKLPSFKNGKEYPNKVISELGGALSSGGEENEFGKDFDTANSSFTLGKNKKISENDLKSSKDSLNIISSISDKIGDSLVGLRNELYVNEYIMGMFKNAVPQLKKAQETGKELKVVSDTTRDLRMKLKGSERKTYFNQDEVEYVLFGSYNEENNERLMKGSILLLRFASNAISIHTDKKKTTEATVAAEAIAAAFAPFTFGSSAALIPAIRETILCAWAMAEAVLDVKHLMEGRFIPLYKNIANGEWIADVGNPQEALKKGENSPMAFSYHDYLRVFLLLKSLPGFNDSKMNKLEDLIQLNMQEAGNSGFMLSGCNTYIQVKTDVSVKYMFLTAAFMPQGIKTGDGRHKISKELYQGY